MSDNLEKFVQANREAFDDAYPSSRIFEKIKAGANTPVRKPIWKLPIFQAAAFLAILLAAVIVYRMTETTKQPAPAEETVYDESAIGDPTYARQFYHFREIIGLKQSELKQLEKEYPQLYNEFVGDIRQLDSSYQSLKVNLADNPNREMLMEAMLRNLQLQSELLNRQLLIIKEIKQKNKKSSHEKNTV
jgi:hypothetical protein